MTVESKETEQSKEALLKEALDEAFRFSDGLPLSESDIDKLAEQMGEGRLLPKRRTNFHE